MHEAVCCERCPEATLANTRHIAKRRLLKAAVFHPQAASAAFSASSVGPNGASGGPAMGAGRDLLADTLAVSYSGPQTASHSATYGAAGIAAGAGDDTLPGVGYLHGHNQNHMSPAYGETSLYRAVTGRILDAGPQVVVIGDGGSERQFALTADSRAWRGGPLDPAALKRGDLATIRLLPDRPNVADRIWANIGRVTGTIVGREPDGRFLVSEAGTMPQQAVIIPASARVRVQVRYPNLQPGYLLDIIGLRHEDYLEGLLPASPQPTYRSDMVQKDREPASRMSDGIAGSAIWHDSAAEPYGVLGVSYPAIDPAASCREDSLARYEAGTVQAFRDLPYLAVGTALTVRNECTGISCTLPVTGCAPMARLFNDRCVACANSPRGRVADLTVASFIALGGELDEGCFSTTLTIGR